MPRPECFRIEYEASRNMPYGIEEKAVPDLLSGGGVLKKGETVWLKEAPNEGSRTGVISPFVCESCNRITHLPTQTIGVLR